MSLLNAIASADLDEILADPETGGESCVITSPQGVPVTFRVLSSDIHLAIDPGTGELVTGRQSTIALSARDLLTAGFSDIRGIASATSKPWTVSLVDVLGRAHTLKVIASHPDNSLGLTLLVLGVYE